jgi:NADH-quinone oxidoreductase subunit F
MSQLETNFVPLDLTAVDEIVQRLGRSASALVPILQAIQEHYHYLPEPALRRLAQITDITPSAITGVSTFYRQFRHRPSGRHIVKVCHGTACHVKGSDQVQEALERYLKLTPGEDTDAAGEFTLERVGCVGCCTLAPVVQVGTVTLGHVTPDLAGALLREASDAGVGETAEEEPEEEGVSPLPAAELRIGTGSCCVAGGSDKVRQALERAVRHIRARAVVRPVGCVGMCHQTPMVEVVRKGRPSIFYTRVSADSAEDIVRRHFAAAGLVSRLRVRLEEVVDRYLLGAEAKARPQLPETAAAMCSFLEPQFHIATEDGGQVDPLDLDVQMGRGALLAMQQIIASGMPPESIIDEIIASGLRGRGGAGFPTGRKWQAVRDAPGEVKYIICNGDEGDPGAFMDRMILESFPFRVLEGMIIAAFATGATQGRLYIRHEYPLAIKRVRAAIAKLQEQGFLGEDILETGQRFHVEVAEGAGAFVCGEETALIASLEGQRGSPRLKPPFPAREGLWRHPTLINNVETFAQVPWIIREGAGRFSAMGTTTSRGTKVFALTGKVRRGGLVEVPMGITLREIVERIGGGVAEGRRFKAVQVGGPSGGCIPAVLADTPVDFESLASAGAIMGSGGMVVLDDRDCMVDIARYFLQFTQAESCGKCSFCRIGTKVMLEILTDLCAGRATAADVVKLEQLAQRVRSGSLCGLGQTAPNPVLTTLRYFRDEYEAHLRGECPAGRCRALVRYVIDSRCIGCSLCARSCPAGAIPFTPYAMHVIDSALCTRCDVCRTACPQSAIEIVAGGAPEAMRPAVAGSEV